MTKIKICGNTRKEDVDLAVELGVDLLGFIFTRSKRQVRVDDVKALLADVPDTIGRVGVFVDESPEQIAAVADACPLTAIQVYRPLTQADRSLGLLLLPAFRVQAGEELAAMPIIRCWIPGRRISSAARDEPGPGARQRTWLGSIRSWCRAA